jgi:hypothetical protein
VEPCSIACVKLPTDVLVTWDKGWSHAVPPSHDLIMFQPPERAVPCCAPGGARYAGSRTSRRRRWCGTGGFRMLSTAARFSRVLSTDSGSRPYGSAIPAALRARTPDERRQSWAGWGMGLGEPSPWVWLRDGTDRLFHAVSVWELPPEEDGPVAVCGRRVLVVSLLDEPAGGRCPVCVAAVTDSGGSGGERGRHSRE